MSQSQQTTIGYVSTLKNEPGELKFTVLLTRDAQTTSVVNRGYIVAVVAEHGQTVYGVIVEKQYSGNDVRLIDVLKKRGIKPDVSNVAADVYVICHVKQKKVRIPYGSPVWLATNEELQQHFRS
jgi:hypothetical protein